MTIMLRIIAWLLATAVTFATLGPTQLRPQSNLGQDSEHALAFVLVGLAFGVAYTRNRLLTSVISVVMIGVLEILQLWRREGTRGSKTLPSTRWRPVPASRSPPHWIGPLHARAGPTRAYDPMT